MEAGELMTNEELAQILLAGIVSGFLMTTIPYLLGLVINLFFKIVKGW